MGYADTGVVASKTAILRSVTSWERQPPRICTPPERGVFLDEPSSGSTRRIPGARVPRDRKRGAPGTYVALRSAR